MSITSLGNSLLQEAATLATRDPVPVIENGVHVGIGLPDRPDWGRAALYVSSDGSFFAQTKQARYPLRTNQRGTAEARLREWIRNGTLKGPDLYGHSPTTASRAPAGNDGYSLLPGRHVAGLSDGFPVPNTQERYDKPPEKVKSQLEQDWRKAVIIAKSAKPLYPLAGRLLERYLENSGKPLVIDSSGISLAAHVINGQLNTYWTFPDLVNLKTQSGQGELMRDVMARKAMDFLSKNTHLNEVSLNSPWISAVMDIDRPRNSETSDTFLALNRFNVALRGVYTAQRDPRGNLIGVSASVQPIGADFYDFSRTGSHLWAPLIGEVPRSSLWMFAHPKVQLAQGFPILITGRVSNFEHAP